MMITIERKKLAILALISLYGLLILLAKSAWVLSHPEALSVGIVFDFTLTIPLVYFLIIRKTTIPNITVVPVFVWVLLYPG